MNFNFSDVSNSLTKKFNDCSLGRKSEVEDNCSIKNFDAPLASVKDTERHCPIENGQWEGERGNSKWIPDDDYIPQKSNPENQTWKEIKSESNIDGITYQDGEPQFGEISKGEVKIENFSTDRSDNFDNADIEMAKQHDCSPEDVAKWRKENKYTWHECRDMETMQKVPSVVHNNVTHSGGISEAKKEVTNNE